MRFEIIRIVAVMEAIENIMRRSIAFSQGECWGLVIGSHLYCLY